MEKNGHIEETIHLQRKGNYPYSKHIILFACLVEVLGVHPKVREVEIGANLEGLP